MTTVADILKYIETLAPTYMKMDWDNVGLLCGSRETPVTKVLVALDPFEGVCREAAEWGAELIVTHHPIIFDPLKSVTEETAVGRSIMTLCRHGISAVNAHTNLDCAPGGVNDVLADTLGLEDVETIPPFFLDDRGRQWGLLRRGRGILCESLGDILRNIDQHRTLAAAHSDLERKADSISKLVNRLYDEVVLCDGHSNSGDVHLLEGVQTQQTAGNVARDGYQRDRVHVSCRNTRNEVGSAGAGSSKHDTSLTGGACVAVGRMAGALLMAGNYMPDFVAVLVQTVVNIENSASRIAENSIRALFEQALNDYI